MCSARAPVSCAPTGAPHRSHHDGYEVSDADSLNGTYVDHERVDRVPLRDMQEVQVGRFVLTFVLGGSESDA